MKIVLISAIWCPSCIIMHERIEKVAKLLNIDLIELDYDDNEEEVKTYQIDKILPVMILTNNNQEVLRLIGEKEENEIINKIKDVM